MNKLKKNLLNIIQLFNRTFIKRFNKNDNILGYFLNIMYNIK